MAPPSELEGVFLGGPRGSLLGPFSGLFLDRRSIFMKRWNVMKIGIWAFPSPPKMPFSGPSQNLIFDRKKLPDALYIGILAIFGLSEKMSFGVKNVLF